MKISNIVVTKPGGLTTSESLASGLPILVISPIPGQEEENAEFLEASGCAVWLKKHDNPKEVLEKVLFNDEVLSKMKENSIRLSKKNSTKDICTTILSKKDVVI